MPLDIVSHLSLHLLLYGSDKPIRKACLRGMDSEISDQGLKQDTIFASHGKTDERSLEIIN